MKAEERRKREKEMAQRMIRLYCRKKHGGKELCSSCRDLLEYVVLRSERCPFMETKTFCSQCRVHCYKPEMRTRIKEVMRFSGPRMLLYHPAATIYHGWCTFQEKRRIKRREQRN